MNAQAGLPLVELRDVTRVYRMGDTDVFALRGINLTIAQGELVAIMGTSGSGKSTLMNMVGCLDRPSQGQCLVNGVDVGKLNAASRAELRGRTVGFVFQNFHLLARTSAMENVELPLVYMGMRRKERQKRARESLQRVGLGSRMDHHPNQLSGGQQQRVAIARALVTQPRLLLADEPTGNLDSKTSVDVMALLQEVHAAGITVVLVTHSSEIAEHAQRVISMHDGMVREDRRQEPRRARPEPTVAA